MSGVSVLAALLIASPLLHWAYLSVLWHFTILEPPFTTSHGLPLALQVFFAPGNIIPNVLGVGLIARSEWTRRIARVVFAIGLAFAAWLVGAQIVSRRLDSNILLAGLSLVLCAVGLWYFGRPQVRAQFAPREAPAIAMTQGSPVARPRSLIVAASIEVLLGLGAAFLLAHLYAVFGTRSLIDMGPGFGLTEADELLRKFLFVTFALFLAPHVLTTAASVGILLGRDMARMARRYAIIACWTMIAAALVAAWLATREGFAFGPGSARLILAFCAFSLAWHACFLYLLARHRTR